MTPRRQYDVFICHASEDKPFVRRLASQLRRRHLRVWLDDWCLGIGQSLTWTINDGLRRSRFGIVVLSRAFFRKAWPKRELEVLLDKETRQAGSVLPIWYRVGAADVRRVAPIVVGFKAFLTDGTVRRSLLAPLVRVLRRARQAAPGPPSVGQRITWESLSALTKRLCRTRRYRGLRQMIDPFWQTRLIADLDTAAYNSIDDIKRAVLRARPAVEAYAKVDPRFFQSGTSYLNKSLGFVDLCFRSRHSWAPETKHAFERYAPMIDWEIGERRDAPPQRGLLARIGATHVPRWVQGLRKRLEMAPSEFATHLGVSSAVISSWEMGRTIPRARHMSRLKTLRKREARRARSVRRHGR